MVNDSENSPAPRGSIEGGPEYQRIRRSLGYLQSRFLERPALEEVAREAGLSEAHFQRLFTRWTGISPKRFMQHLTLERAKQMLAASKPVLEAAFEAGLSGPGRLHDLFVSVEAVTPGEYRRRGADLQIQFGFQSSPFGTCLLGLTGRGICWLSFLEDGKRQEAVCEMREYWAGAEFLQADDKTASMAARVFSRLRGARDLTRGLSLFLAGTNFQLKVWQALLRIPAGRVVSYGTLGGAVGAPGACRAIGSAVGRNPIAYLVPCHRVIRESGALGGYRWGEDRKRAMLNWELND